MAERLSLLIKLYLSDAAAFRRRYDSPVLVWTGAPRTAGQAGLWTTRSIDVETTPTENPLVFALEKVARSPNVFELGVTVGRTPNNDIEVSEPSVSRFHAYFKKSERGEAWEVVDVESFNGTFVRGERLKPRTPAQVGDQDLVRFGAAEMRFFSPAALVEYVKRLDKVNGVGPART